jgi:hypothetical protein
VKIVNNCQEMIAMCAPARSNSVAQTPRKDALCLREAMLRGTVMLMVTTISVRPMVKVFSRRGYAA